MSGKGTGNSLTLISKNEILSVVCKHLNAALQNVIIKNYELKPASDNPLGFLGEHMKISVQAIINDELKQLHYFMKIIPSTIAVHVDYVKQTRAFYKEVQMYTTIFNDYEEYDRLVSAGKKWRPELYYFRGSELCVMEDLSIQGYYGYPERTLVDKDHIKAVLEAVAAMHAASFVLQHKSSNSIGDVYSHINFETEATDEKGHPGYTFYETGIKSLASLVELLPGYSTDSVKSIQQMIPEKASRFYQFVKPSTKHKNIFIHGDLWPNNLMFRKQGDSEIQAVIVDFQLARYAPPAHELVMLLHLCQNTEFRWLHQHDLLKHYYHHLNKELARHSLTATDVGLSFEDLLQSYADYHEYGVLCAAFYFQVVFQPPQVAAKLVSSPDYFHNMMFVDRNEMVKEAFLKDEFCRTQLTEVLNEYIQQYVLEEA